MASYSKEFGDAVKALRKSLGLSRLAAFEAVGGAISQSYWERIEAGTIPTYDKVAAIRLAFGDAARDVVAASGYTFANGPILSPIVASTARLPLGPAVSALRGRELSEVFGGETVEVQQWWIDEGATHTLVVDGDCLSPRLVSGDVVGLKLQDYATHGQIVLARIPSTGEYTLKRYSETNGGHLERADGTLMDTEYSIVAVAVGVTGAL